MTITVRAVFHENNKYYPQVFPGESLYKILKKSKNELKEIDINNWLCYYFDDIINGSRTNFRNILLDKKSYETISFYNISYKTPTCPKPVGIRFDEIVGLIISFDGTVKHLILFGY